MYYYKRNLGDYAKKAGRLSMLQHGAYTLLIDACYDREQFPTMADAIDWTWASSSAEVEAVQFVLTKFFTLMPDGRYVQSRIQDELLEYQAMAATNKRIAEERETKRKNKTTTRERPVNDSPPNQEPLTTNQEPRTKNPPQPLPELDPVREMKPEVALSIAFRQCGIKTQPANPKLLELVKQGVAIDTVKAACEEAKSVKPDAGFGYVLAIIERWSKEAKQMQVQGVVKPHARASPIYQTPNEKAKEFADKLTGRARNESTNRPDFIDINPA